MKQRFGFYLLAALFACCQTNVNGETEPTSIQILEPWTNTVIKLLVTGPSAQIPAGSRLEEIRAKMAVFKIVPAPQPGRGVEKVSILKIRDSHVRKHVFIRAGQSFYISDLSGMKGYTVLPGALAWSSSYMELPDSTDDMAANARFEREFDGRRVNEELFNSGTNRLPLTHAVPMSFFSDAPGWEGVGGLLVSPEVEAVGMTNDLMQLVIRNPKTQQRASLTIDLSAKKVIRSVAQGQEMDINTGRPWAVPLNTPRDMPVK